MSSRHSFKHQMVLLTATTVSVGFMALLFKFADWVPLPKISSEEATSTTGVNLSSSHVQGEIVASLEGPSSPSALAKVENNAQSMPITIMDWRTLAPPLAVGQDSLLYFQQQDTLGIGWKMDWKTNRLSYFSLQNIPVLADRNGVRRYGVIQNKHGLWLIGPSIWLLKSEVFPVTLPFDATDPNVVGLPDDSILVIGDNRNNEIKRVRLVSLKTSALGEDTIEVTTLPDLPVIRRYGVATAALADGRVMVAGGSGAETRVHLFDPKAKTWSETSSLPVGRINAILLPLPDGRVVIAGSDWSPSDNAHRADIWNPRTGAWQSLPTLPLSMKVTSHNVSSPGGTVLPDGSLVLGGGMGQEVMLLRAKGKDWAPTWEVVGRTETQRVGGFLQALGNNEVVVVGGLMSTDPDGSGCCARASGVSRIKWDDTQPDTDRSMVMERHEFAHAQRGHELFAAGGWKNYYMSFGAIQFSSMAELVDLETQRVRSIAPLPEPIGSGQAVWIDDHRLVLQGSGGAVGPDYSALDERTIEQRGKNNYLALYDRRLDQWQMIDSKGAKGDQLIGAYGSEAILQNSSELRSINLKTRETNYLPRTTLERQGGTGRVLADGRIIVAGGQAQSTLVAVESTDCDSEDCADQYVGFGELSAVDGYEIYYPTKKSWESSAPSKGQGTQAVVLANGRVAQINHRKDGAQSSQIDSSQLMIECSSADGRSWETLPTPTDSFSCSSLERNDCVLLLADDPLNPGQELLFFRKQMTQAAVWMFDEAAKHWISVEGHGVGLEPIALPIRQGESRDKHRRWGVGFEQKKISVWGRH